MKNLLVAMSLLIIVMILIIYVTSFMIIVTIQEITILCVLSLFLGCLIGVIIQPLVVNNNNKLISKKIKLKRKIKKETFKKNKI